MKVSHLPAVLERAKKNHDFPGKVRKTRQADRSKYAEAKREAGKGHHFAKPTQLIENQRARFFTQFSCQGKQEGKRESVSKYQHNGTGRGENSGARNSQENITHVHYARVTKHPIEPFLRDSDQTNIDNVTKQQRHEQISPVMRAFGE